MSSKRLHFSNDDIYERDSEHRSLAPICSAGCQSEDSHDNKEEARSNSG